ncbi:hypothetical protein BK666_20930 [Pseudomonas frederiksbergensis]|uniref:Uncharacterized protein n=1 Tax=Pseudomonas frederiksbergensis TaxID=104087 RepID=A0A423K005_9PSED|nr:hypothetical protein [Pseudomonas frederiksbergensis]RON43536.1 hypothetical protein BK666_20930 [Pseudomonas frederiksbergensis]
MKSGEQLIQVEHLRKFTHLLTMDGRQGWDSTQHAALLQALADSEKTTYIGCIADAFGVENPQIFAIGDLVRIIALPSSLFMDELSEEIRSFATNYGYVAAISGRGLYGADIYFIDHGALALATAAETFTKLRLLGSA